MCLKLKRKFAFGNLLNNIVDIDHIENNHPNWGIPDSVGWVPDIPLWEVSGLLEAVEDAETVEVAEAVVAVAAVVVGPVVAEREGLEQHHTCLD